MRGMEEGAAESGRPEQMDGETDFGSVTTQRGVMLPDYTKAERWADGIIHVISVVFAIAGAAVLLALVIPLDAATTIAAAAIYGFGLVATAGISAAYHLFTDDGVKEWLRPFDHAAIYLMIAGSYTPFAVIAIGGWLGTTLLSLVWTIAVAGIAIRFIRPRGLERLSIALYIVMGWIGLPAIGVLIVNLPTASLILLLVGGILYTGGVSFHVWTKLRFQNAVWHFCVLAAAVCHWVAILMLLTATPEFQGGH